MLFWSKEEKGCKEKVLLQYGSYSWHSKLYVSIRRVHNMKPHPAWRLSKNAVKFRIPIAENLVPIRLDVDIDGQRFRDTFTWNHSDPVSDVILFAKQIVKDLKLPLAFVTQIA